MRFQEILVYWLNKSVDGFYIRNSAYMFEDYDLRDEPKLQYADGDVSLLFSSCRVEDLI